MYHFLLADMKSGAGNEPPWVVGESRSITAPPVLCRLGYHASSTLFDALQYAPGPVLCLVELTGVVLVDRDKAVGQGRWLLAAVNVERELRLFACDCAERALPIFELLYPQDQRPREAILVARRHADGQATYKELDAARVAAAAATDAAGAARVATRAATWTAAAGAATDAAARAATWVVARVARVATRDAARAAADAAAATWAAADAATDAARDAARDAERLWQTNRLEALLLPSLKAGSPQAR